MAAIERGDWPSEWPDDWYETIRMSDDVTLIHEPWIKPFYRCNMWHVRGRDRDLLFDSGLGHVGLRRHVRLVAGRPIVCVASHTHFDHIGSHHEFEDRRVEVSEAAILADPRREWTLADRYATDQMFDRLPPGWDAAAYRIRPAPATVLLRHGDRIDLGDRAFDVIHSDRVDYALTMEKLRSLRVEIVHGGHFPSFGPVRYRQIIDEYLSGARIPGCHLRS